MNTEESEKCIQNEPAVLSAMLTPERSQKLDLLVHLIANSQEVLVICGPEGIGKSKLMQLAEDRNSESWTVCRLTASRDLTFLGIQRNLLNSIGGDQVDMVIASTLREKLQGIQKNNQRLVLLLDDAGVLAPGILTSVCRFVESCPALRVVFSLTADRLHLMASSDPDVENCQVIELPPLNEQQCGDYLKLLSANPNSLIPLKTLKPHLIQRVYRESHGVPGRILGLLPEVAKGDGMSVRQTPFPIFSLLIFCIAVLAGYLLWDGSTLDSDVLVSGVPGGGITGSNSPVANIGLPGLKLQKKEPKATADADSERIVLAKDKSSENFTTQIEVDSDQELIVDQDSLSSNENSSILAKELGDGDQLDKQLESVLTPGKVVKPIDEPINPMNQGIVNETVNMLVNNSLLPENDADALIRSVDKENRNQSLEQSPSDQAMLEFSSGTSDSVDDFSRDELIADAVEIENQSLSATDHEHSVQVTADPDPSHQPKKDSLGFRDAQWILKQKPNSYTLQLMAVKDSKSMQTFIRKHPGLSELAVFRTRKSGGAWYALIQGQYDSLSAAKKAAGQLPAELQKAWPRKLKSVHKAIASFGEQ